MCARYSFRVGLKRLLVGATIVVGIFSGATLSPSHAFAQDVLREAPYSVGMTQLEYLDSSEGGRPLNLMLIYPAAPAPAASPFKIFMSADLHLYKDAPVVSDGLKHVDSEPARDVHDDRVKAAFAMAPGDIQAFGMDEAGLRQMAIPAYIIVGAADTTTPPNENAGFAAKNIPHAQLDVLPGPIGHEIFDNECDQVGRDNFPEACADAAGVDRGKLHAYIGEAALQFFDSNLHVRRDRAK